MAKRKKTGIKEIAARAGVSTAAVSAVLNDKTDGSIRVGAETREKIRKTIEELGYVPDPAARRLVSGRSNIVSVFTYEPVFPFSPDNEFHRFLVGIENQAESLGYDILLITNGAFRTCGIPAYESEINRLKMADGGILIGIKKDREVVGRLVDEGFPLVLVGRRDIGGRPVSYVGYDYPTIVDRLFDLATEARRSKALYIRLKGLSEPYEDRLEAVKLASKRHPSLGTETAELGATAEIEALLALPEKSRPGVFILERREIATAFEAACETAGLVPGKDVSAVLLEDRWFDTKLDWTCWTNVRADLGAHALGMLDRLISGESTGPLVEHLLPEVVPGGTLAGL